MLALVCLQGLILLVGLKLRRLVALSVNSVFLRVIGKRLDDVLLLLSQNWIILLSFLLSTFWRFLCGGNLLISSFCIFQWLALNSFLYWARVCLLVARLKFWTESLLSNLKWIRYRFRSLNIDRILLGLSFPLLFSTWTTLFLHAQTLILDFPRHHFFRVLNLINSLNKFVQPYH